MTWHRVTALFPVGRIGCLFIALVMVAWDQPTKAFPTSTAIVPPEASATNQPAVSTANEPKAISPTITPNVPGTAQGLCTTSAPYAIEPKTADRARWCEFGNGNVHITYPDAWIVSLMGAAGQNRLFQTLSTLGVTRTIRVVFAKTDLAIEQADKAMDGGYELSPSQPFVNPHETAVARYLKTVGDNKLWFS